MGGGATIGLLVRRGMGNYSTLILNKKCPMLNNIAIQDDLPFINIR